MTQHLTDQQLTDIDGHLAAYRQHGPTGFACCSAHPVADAVPELLAEVRRLRTENERMRHELEVMYDGAFDELPAPAAVSAAVAPPTDQTTAEAALAAVEAALCDTLLPDAREEALARLMTVLPEAADRAAILREAADRAEVVALRLRLKHDTGAANGAYEVMDELRRMADEEADQTTPPAEPTAEEIARAHVTSLHLIGEQLATIESWFWEHLADVRDASKQQDGAET
ncbi:hypothetical protein ABZ485_28105 [Streptomyces albogriseolus]|uniref:hypothetical protein n=1 Tax=Streptomyces albogriseolus TaxID=1887 RepID=UPI0034614784